MDANRFFSINYDNRNDITIKRMRKSMGGIAAYGRWVALLGMLYDSDGILDMNDQCMREIVAEELEVDDVDAYFLELCRLGLVDAELYNSTNHVSNRGVCDELAYHKAKREAGKLGGRPRRAKEKAE